MGRISSTCQSARKRGGGTGREEGWQGPLTVFCQQNLLSNYYGLPTTVDSANPGPNPALLKLVLLSLSLSQNLHHIAHLPQKVLFDYFYLYLRSLCTLIRMPHGISRRPGRRAEAFASCHACAFLSHSSHSHVFVGTVRMFHGVVVSIETEERTEQGTDWGL